MDLRRLLEASAAQANEEERTMSIVPFRGRCHTCGHDAEDTRLRDILDILARPPRPLPTAASAEQMRAWLAESEAARRSRDRTFDPSPGARCDPDKDWGFLLSVVGRATQQLDEGMPNGQRDRVLPAYRALCAATQGLGEWLRSRG